MREKSVLFCRVSYDKNEFGEEKVFALCLVMASNIQFDLYSYLP